MDQYMSWAYCGHCGSKMKQAAEGTTVYHLCPYCGISFSMVISEVQCLAEIPPMLTEEGVEIVSQIDSYWEEDNVE